MLSLLAPVRRARWLLFTEFYIVFPSSSNPRIGPGYYNSTFVGYTFDNDCASSTERTVSRLSQLIAAETTTGDTLLPKGDTFMVGHANLNNYFFLAENQLMQECWCVPPAAPFGRVVSALKETSTECEPR
eukprot:997657-Prorocentrum_minimum.AAC.2